MTKHTLTKLAVIPLLLATPLLYAAGPDLSETRTALQEWVQLRKQISEEATNWRVDKELMADTISVLGAEMGLLEERILAAEENTTVADKKREELTAENEKLKSASRAVEGAMPEMEKTVRELVTWFPPALNERIEQLVKRMPSPERARTSRAALGGRVQNVVGILQEIEKFNRQITIVTELKSLDSGEMAQVKTMYIGLGQGYFVDENAKYAGVVRPAADGWTEEVRNDLAPAIRDAVKIYEGEMLAEFVALPVEIN